MDGCYPVAVPRVTERRSGLILWFAMLWAVAAYYLVMRLLRPPAPAPNPLLVTTLVAAALVLVIASFAIKARLFARGLPRPGQVIALTLCDAAAILGLVLWFVTGARESYYPLVIGCAGLLLHYPRCIGAGPSN